MEADYHCGPPTTRPVMTVTGYDRPSYTPATSSSSRLFKHEAALPREEERGKSDECEAAMPMGRDNCCYLPLRYVVMVMGFLGCAVEFILRYSLSVAIVAMVNSTSTTTDTHHHVDDNHTQQHHDVCLVITNTTQAKGNGEYNWSEQQEAIILGIFFWGYFITKVPGGRISEMVGGRITLCVCLGTCGVLSLVSPLAASLHPLVLAGVRLVMGLLQGVYQPALYSVLNRWALPGELGSMIAITFSGMSLGMVVGLGCWSWVVETMGWRWAFYGSGLLALAWTPLWFLLVRDDPQHHPFISLKEKERLNGITIQPRRRVPWSRMLRCSTVYLLALVEFAMSWLATIYVTQGPTFLHDKVGLDANTSGQVMLAMTVTNGVSGWMYGWLTDLIHRRNLLSKVATRRLIFSLGYMLGVGGGVGLVVDGCNTTLVFVTFIGYACCVSSLPVTYQLTPMDIAPNFSSTIIGVIGVGQLGGFLAPLVNAKLIPKPNGWNKAILLATFIYAAVGILYLLGVTDEEQEWNLYEQVDDISCEGEKRSHKSDV